MSPLPPPPPAPSATVDVRQHLLYARAAAYRNARVLDHISHSLYPPPPPSSPSASASPISKNILSSVFSAVARPSPHNHVFIPHHPDQDFLHGLVLPVVARLLAVSCPGLLVVVQLPRPDNIPDWATPQDAEGSSGSKSGASGAHTSLSGAVDERTPSPSDEGVAGRKSVSPESGDRTEELIRHADQVLSGREGGGGVLPFICNGFEVLTGKMPPPRMDMGRFTLATVGWEKAGVMQPEKGFGVNMSFSNGMMTTTDGVVVSFSNGSLCWLTLRDPLEGAGFQCGRTNPVIVFSFAHVGNGCVDEALKGKTCEAGERVKSVVGRKNWFVVEIGRLPNGGTNDVEEKKMDDDCNVPPPATVLRCPPLTISDIPRAQPLFVNTINHTVIDSPFYDFKEYGHQNGLMNGHPGDIPHERYHPDLRIEGKRNTQGDHSLGKEGHELGGDQKIPMDERLALSSQRLPTMDPRGNLQAPSPPNNLSNTGNRPPHDTDALQHTNPVGVSNGHGPHPGTGAKMTNHQLPSMYNYYGYNPMYARGNRMDPVGAHQTTPSMNGYYHPAIGGAKPHGPNGFHPSAVGRPFGGPGYYPMGVGPGMVHAAGGGQSRVGWHQGMRSMGGHEAAMPLPPPHLIDARRDMPAHFSSHRAVAAAGQHGGGFYGGAGSSAAHGRHMYENGYNGMTRTGEGGSNRMQVNAMVSKEGAGNEWKMGRPRSGGHGDREGIETQSRDKESAMHALIQMREGVTEDEAGDTRKAGKRARHDRAGSEEQISGQNEEGKVEIGEAAKVRKRSCGTNSSASTNSQGAALMQGAMTGNSGYVGGEGGSGPQAKRSKMG